LLDLQKRAISDIRKSGVMPKDWQRSFFPDVARVALLERSVRVCGSDGSVRYRTRRFSEKARVEVILKFWVRFAKIVPKSD
jgi:hypothetical protein